MAKAKFSLEEAFLELDSILKQLEDPALGLADSMEFYKKGVKLLEKCNQTLDKTEKEIIILQEEQNGSIHKGKITGEE